MIIIIITRVTRVAWPNPFSGKAFASNLMNCSVALAVASCSQCPDNTGWMDVVAPLLAAERMRYWNIGANKGYNVNEWLLRHAAGWKTTNGQWHKHLQEKTATPFTCGACRACLAPPPRVAPKRATSASVLAVELLNSTYNGLLGAFSRFGVPGEVVHAACADRVGEAREPVGIDAGTESRGISKGGVRVPQTTVDALWAARPGGGEGVSILSVDTEGWDPLVLRGAASLLQQRLVGVLEFEYHVVGPWATTDLREVLGWLRQTGGYHCYWQSNCAPRLKTHSNMIRAAPVQRPAFVVPRAARSTLPAHRADGVLAPALTEPECQFPRSWSNMVCASAPELRAALDGLTRGVSLDMLDDCAATAGGKHLVNAAKKRVHANHSALGLL